VADESNQHKRRELRKMICRKLMRAVIRRFTDLRIYIDLFDEDGGNVGQRLVESGHAVQWA
jgi:hypothetical protein